MSMVHASGLSLDMLATTIKERVRLGDRDTKKGEDHYLAAGLHLVEAQARVRAELPGTPWLTWSAINFPDIKERRIQQLMQIGRGETTQAEINAASNSGRYRVSDEVMAEAEETIRRYGNDANEIFKKEDARKNASESEARERDAKRKRRERAERDALRVANGGKPSRPRAESLFESIRPRLERMSAEDVRAFSTMLTDFMIRRPTADAA